MQGKRSTTYIFYAEPTLKGWKFIKITLIFFSYKKKNKGD